MKAKDLMLGDAVLTPKGINYVLRLRYDEIWVGDIVALSRFFEEDLQPIPLTPEILDKFGPSDNVKLDGCEDFREWFIKGEGRTIVIFEEKPSKSYLVGGIQIHYVHELQHFLRLCGIEKEIEL